MNRIPFLRLLLGRQLPPNDDADAAALYPRIRFTYEELAMATDGFSDSNFLETDAFAHAYRGTLDDGREVVVREFHTGSRQWEKHPFRAELDTVGHLHHENLVSLIGSCVDGNTRLTVYEHVPNNNLAFHLHGYGQCSLNWDTRFKIAYGCARGLAYLHEDCQPRIIHRDIKPENILLDSSFEPKIAGFGVATFLLDGEKHVERESQVPGAARYVDPRYIVTGETTEEVDVYSFGVMLIELIAGKAPDLPNYKLNITQTSVDWARPLLARALLSGDYKPLADPHLESNYNSNEMSRLVACAAACVQPLWSCRPRMSQIVQALEGLLPPELLLPWISVVSPQKDDLLAGLL